MPLYRFQTHSRVVYIGPNRPTFRNTLPRHIFSNLKRRVIEKKSFKSYASRIESQPLKMYDISPQDFAHHVRHATSWQDLGIRCGMGEDEFGKIQTYNCKLLIQKVKNMQLDTQHFHGQTQVTDDDFKTIVKESTCLTQVKMKCNISTSMDKEKILKRIEFLCIDITHWKPSKIPKTYDCHNKVDAIDDETFKTLVKDNTKWRNLAMSCGYYRDGGRIFLVRRIEKLGLNTDHFDDVTPTDKIFVVDSHFTNIKDIKKRLVRDFDRVYECAGCKNHAFTKSDGVLLWNNKEIVLQLEHKNGINNDNRIDNLEFLCPSCHSQTSTFTGKNNKKHKALQTWIEEGKTCHAPGSIASLLN
jgi:hypothetical protein